jgi:DNA-binding transcriptional LysR family regulator
MELRHLRYFVTVAEELHFRRAAERLNMTQPPLSQQIRQLEDELGVQLFNRVGRSIELSDAGRVFLEEAQQTLAQVEYAVQAARRAARGEIGRLVVGFVGTAAYRVLPSTLRVFQERFPNVEVVLREMTTLHQAKALRAEQMDVGFLRPPVDGSGLEVETVFREPLVVALTETHPLTVNERVTLEMLASEPFILFPRWSRPTLYDQIMCLCQQVGFSPQVAQKANQVEAILGLVSVGMGVTLLPASIQEWRRSGVVYKSLANVDLLDEMAVAWRQNDASSVLKVFLEVVREVFYGAGGAGHWTPVAT